MFVCIRFDSIPILFLFSSLNLAVFVNWIKWKKKKAITRQAVNSASKQGSKSHKIMVILLNHGKQSHVLQLTALKGFMIIQITAIPVN